MKALFNAFDRISGLPSIGLSVLTVTVAVVIVALAVFARKSWWQTPDQQAQWLFDHGEFAAAAEIFTSAQRRGAALFRAGEFEAAASAFARVNSAQGYFNRGNALVMNGKYEEAIKAYERALVLLPDWPEASNNLEIARLRAEKTKLEGGGMTSGKMGADEIVFETEKRNTDTNEQAQVEGGQEVSDSALQALWLRRVQTSPAVFLRTKFVFQLAEQKRDEAGP
jgi:Ca-activated chloride channel family protein